MKWPRPEWPWIMDQRWEHLLYLHFPVDPVQLREQLPTALELDLFRGQAYVSLIPLHMNRVHIRDLFPVPTTYRFPELNLRTYVRHGDRQGVWFLSIDACSWFSVQIAQRAFHIPYHDADMSFTELDGEYRLTSRRDGAPEVQFEARYRPLGTPGPPAAGSIDAYLAERYSMFAEAPGGRLLRGDISHTPWMVQQAEATVVTNTMLEAVGVTALGPPTMAYSPGTHAVAWPMSRAH